MKINNIETKLNKLMKIYNKMNSINKISITYDIIKKEYITCYSYELFI